jgi:uncharacterized coiled-coil DUF342 family protein
MNIETLKKEEFDTVKALANMSIKISEARETLTELQNTETTYIEERERKAVEKIQEVFEKSKDLLDQIHNNNEEVKTLYTVVSGYKDFLSEGQEKFTKLLQDFNERSELWEKFVEEKYKEFGKFEQEVMEQKRQIEQDKEDIKDKKEELRRIKIKLDDEREIIKRAVERLKNKQK